MCQQFPNLFLFLIIFLTKLRYQNFSFFLIQEKALVKKFPPSSTSFRTSSRTVTIFLSYFSCNSFLFSCFLRLVFFPFPVVVFLLFFCSFSAFESQVLYSFHQLLYVQDLFEAVLHFSQNIPSLYLCFIHLFFIFFYLVFQFFNLSFGLFMRIR